jgi:hypothetical protein
VLARVVSYVCDSGQRVPRCVRGVFFNSPPVGGSPAAAAPSGTALGAADPALCANERTQAARGICRKRRVLANIEKGVRKVATRVFA